MRSTTILVLMGLVLSACGDTDVANREGELAPGEEVEDQGLELDVEAVRLDTVAWFTEGRTVEFNNRSWIIAGEPIFDPAVEHVGEFEGTQLYAEVGVAPPYNELFIPVGDDYWQMLEAAAPTPAPAAEGDTGLTQLR